MAVRVQFAFLGVVPVVVLLAVAVIHARLEVAHVVHPSEGDFGVLAVFGDGHAGAVAHLVLGGVAHALGAGQGLHGDVVKDLGVGLLGRPAAGAAERVGGDHADQRVLGGGAVDDGLELLGRLGHGQLGDQALGVQLAAVAQTLAQRLAGQRGGHRAVVHHQARVGVIRIVQEGVEQVAHHVAAQLVRAVARAVAHQRQLVGLAVAVGILLLEGLERGIQLVGGRGHGQIQLVQPGLVDVEDVLVVVARLNADVGEGIDVAVPGVHLAPEQLLRLLAQVLLGGLIEVIGVLLEVLVHGQQDALTAIVHLVADAQQQNFRKFLLRGDHQVDLLRGVGVGQEEEVEGDAGLVLDPEGEVVGVVIHHVGLGGQADRQRHAVRRDGQHARRRHAGHVGHGQVALGQRARAAQRDERAQEQGKQSFRHGDCLLQKVCRTLSVAPLNHETR